MRNNEQEKLDQQELEKLFELRDTLVLAMTPIFGKSVENMGRIVFDDYTNKKLAQILDCKNIGRHLQTPNLQDKNQPKSDSFGNLIAKVQLFKTHIEQPLKENKELQKTNVELRNQLEISKGKNKSIPFFITGLITLAAVSGWLYFQQPKESKQSQVISEKSNEKGVYGKEQYNAFFQFMGTGNLKYMYDAALEENAANNRILETKETLSKGDSIQSIDNMMTKILRIIYESRAKVEDLNFLIEGKKNVIEFADFVIPRHSLFKLKANQIIEIDADNIPKSLDYSSYDEALIKCKKYILGKDVSTLDIISSIDNVARISQVSLRQKTSTLYDCYMLYGDSCFDYKKLECYQKNNKTQKSKNCFQ